MASPPPSSPAGRLIVALDLDEVAEAEALIDTLGDSVGVYKIGMQLGFAGGLELARRLADDGKAVFLDLKLLDIANTVAGGIASIARLGAAFTTVHAYPQTMRAAAEASAGTGLTVLAVTVLTSLNADDLHEAGYAADPQALVERRARQAVACGLGGVVASAREAVAIRAAVGRDLVIVTPGIRPAGAQSGDQKRITTPADAIKAGADYLVVGRPIVQAADPRRAARAIVDEIEESS